MTADELLHHEAESGPLPIPGSADPEVSPEEVYRAACAYVDAGLSIIPIAADMSKSPDWHLLPQVLGEGPSSAKSSWLLYQVRRPRPAELDAWFKPNRVFDQGPPGIAVIGGAVSGALEIIDFDKAEAFEPWSQLVEARCPGLWQRLVLVQTPRPGIHAYYRCPVWSGNEKLAYSAEIDANGQPILDAVAGKVKLKTLIEKKGEGGYCLAPPSPRHCHPAQISYQLAFGSPPLTRVPTVTIQERAVLLQAARALSNCPDPEGTRCPQPRIRSDQNAGGRPGDAFNETAAWEDLLQPHGWVKVGSSGCVDTWRRPGKGEGISATTNYEGSGLLYVFSTNAEPFDAERGYSKFAAYALLEHGGDWKAAAEALRQKGYGLKTLITGVAI